MPIDRRGVSQPSSGLTQRQVGEHPGGAPALGVALTLRHAGDKNLLDLEDLSGIQMKPGTTARSWGDIGD